jgi:hypothetical protein
MEIMFLPRSSSAVTVESVRGAEGLLIGVFEGTDAEDEMIRVVPL